jgi:hypothetical protein
MRNEQHTNLNNFLTSTNLDLRHIYIHVNEKSDYKAQFFKESKNHQSQIFIDLLVVRTDH